MGISIKDFDNNLSRFNLTKIQPAVNPTQHENCLGLGLACTLEKSGWLGQTFNLTKPTLFAPVVP